MPFSARRSSPRHGFRVINKGSNWHIAISLWVLAASILPNSKSALGERTRLFAAGPCVQRFGVSLIWRLRESLAVALFNTAHGPEQMIIRACPKLLRLAVKGLHHERIKNADLFQCFHVAMDAGESGIETVEKIVDEGFWCAVRICVSHRSPFFGR